MSYPINYPTPQGANVQIFNATGGTAGAAGSAGAKTLSTWVKPQGASFVWFTLIGSGGSGDNASVGGGSGAVTNFMCPAFLIPDSLQVYVGRGGNATAGLAGADTIIAYQQKNGTGYTLLTAEHGTSGAGGGAAMTANAFTAMGLFQSVAGQSGSAGSQSASATTFLSGGAGTNPTTANYGYATAANGSFQMQPIIVGVGGTNGANAAAITGIGCGGGLGSLGGAGMAVIITW